MTGDRLAGDVIRMEGAKTWAELEAICRDLDAAYEVEGVHPDIRRVYENLKTHHARRVAGSFAAA